MAQVSVCPKTYEEIKVASSKLRCKNDSYGNNQYMCIPNSEKTSLVQFCDDGEMGLVEEGNCLEASVGRVILRNCSEFLSGCPNTSYDKNAVYKYPKCQEINTVGKCYIADPSCPPQMTNDLSNIYANVGIAVAVISAIVLVCYCWRELLTLFYRCTTRLRICFKPEIGNDMKEKEPEKVYLTSDQDDQERDTSPCQPNTDPLNGLQRTTDENSSLQGNDISGAEVEGVCLTSDQNEQGGVPSLFQPNTNLSLQKTTNEHSSSQGDFKVTVIEDAQIKFLCPPSNTGLELTMSGNASIQAVCGAADVGNINEGMNLKTAAKNEKSNQKLKMVYPKMQKEEEEFQLLHEAICLPRYTYHWSLVEWYMEGLPKDILFTGCHLESCLIIIGGIITDEEKKVLFGESALSERLNVKGLQKEAEKNTTFLIVYFFNGDLTKMGEDIEKLDRILPFKDGHGHVLVVMEMKYSCDRKIIIEGIRAIGITKVEVVMKTRSIIVQNITCILEQMLSSYLEGTKKTLLEHSHTQYVDSSLLEVNAILKRLKQAKCYPEPLTEIVEPENNEIGNILLRFPEKIIYSVQDRNGLHIIASDEATKESLETLLSGSDFQNISFVVTVEDKLPISELSKTGVPLHGAKFVYVNLGIEAFNTDECFATTGSLMQANNNSLMVAVTCRHALERNYHFYTLIENSVVRLGEEVKQPNNNMERLHDDISVVRIDDATRSIVDEKCEKLLIDYSKFPSPARISERTLVKGDIVHKRGAKSGLTTGIVKDVRTQKIGRFTEKSPVIFITGRDSIPFAEKGDSGSLVFQHSLDPEENLLDVLAMVQGKVNVPIRNADVICFPFIEGCVNLQNHIPDIQNLEFFNH